MVDAVEAMGAPEYFVDHYECEIAGTGLVRVFGISVRAGVSFVAYSVVMTAECALTATRMVSEAAQASVLVQVSH